MISPNDVSFGALQRTACRERRPGRSLSTVAVPEADSLELAAVLEKSNIGVEVGARMSRRGRWKANICLVSIPECNSIH